MRHRFALAAPLLAMLSMGCTEEPATTTTSGGQEPSLDASISAVIPNKVFLARTLDVTVSGFGTNWTDATKVEFGAGIVVSSQTVASPTAIVATIEVGEEALLGARDVNVVDSAGTTTYKNAFKIESPLDLAVTGTSAQGSILVTKAKQLDLSTPFDTTSTGDGFFEPFVYTNINVAGSPGINAQVEGVEMYSADLLVLVDIDAPAGKSDLTVHSGPLGDTLASPAPDGLDIAARMPEPLSEGASVKGKVEEPLGTLLFSFAPSGPGLYAVTASASSQDANPNLVVLPKSGKFAEMMDFSGNPSILATNTDPFYFVYWDNSGTSSYFATVKAEKVVTADVDPNDTCAMAQPAGALPANIKNLFLSSKEDVDWISFDVVSGNEGKIVHVTTAAGDVKTDTIVEVFASNCTTSLGGPSSDGDYHENHKSAAIAAPGKHFVKVTNSSIGYTGKLYDLSIALETP